MKKYIFYYDFPIGRIGIAEKNGNITDTFLGEDDLPPQNQDIEEKETPLIQKAAAQLREYCEGTRKTFDLPLEPEYGTPYMRSVWKALCDIPYGETASYGQIATVLGNPKAARAVGLANNRNPLGIFVPCHRVIGSNGKLVGYAGGLDMKEKLLALEKNNVHVI